MTTELKYCCTNIYLIRCQTGGKGLFDQANMPKNQFILRILRSRNEPEKNADSALYAADIGAIWVTLRCVPKNARVFSYGVHYYYRNDSRR